MRNLTFCIFLFFFFSVSGAHLDAQENEYLYGKVLEQETGAPVVFASVQIKGWAKGVITNQDGSFRLPFELLTIGESIEISSMGYAKKSIEIEDLSLNEINIIYLAPGVFSLTETVVSAKRKRRLTARRIVRNAIENIPNNYPTTNFTLKGYYRDYQLDRLGYVNLNEALLEVFDPGFDEIDSTSTKTRLYEYLQNKSFRRDSLADDPYNYKEHRKIIDNAYLGAYGGNEFAILRIHDAIRNYRINSYDFINNMKERDILKNHSFKRLSDTYLDDEPLHTIQLKRMHPDYTVRGILYISQNDFAIHKLEYAIYDKKKRNFDEKLWVQGIKGKLIFEVTTEYKRRADYKMYLSYISLHNTFRLTIPPKFIIKELLVSAPTNTFVITLNNKLAQEPNAEKSDWYDFKYRDQKLKFKEIKVVDDTLVTLLPSRVNKSWNNMIPKLVIMSQKGHDIGEILKFKVTGLLDVDGNLLNQPTYKEYDQFREFFVQETENLFKLPEDSLLMDKRKPIFQDQPVSRPENFDQYWMNTPLQKSKQKSP